MNSLIAEIDSLKQSLELEANLRHATEAEFSSGIEHGPMRQAHDASINSVVNAAKRLVERAETKATPSP